MKEIFYIGDAFPYGVYDSIPEIVGAPAGVVRIRMRNNDAVRVFIKTKEGIECYIPDIKDGKWIVSPPNCQGKNWKPHKQLKTP